jgi:Zn finger protein HypA/HybF involved in hydrogenase expression
LATQAYCVKCKTKRDMKDEKQVTMKNGQKALSGMCTTCGTKMFRIGGGGGKKIVRATAKEGKKGNLKAKVKAKGKSKRK